MLYFICPFLGKSLCPDANHQQQSGAEVLNGRRQCSADVPRVPQSAAVQRHPRAWSRQTADHQLSLRSFGGFLQVDWGQTAGLLGSRLL